MAVISCGDSGLSFSRDEYVPVCDCGEARGNGAEFGACREEDALDALVRDGDGGTSTVAKARIAPLPQPTSTTSKQFVRVR